MPREESGGIFGELRLGLILRVTTICKSHSQLDDIEVTSIGYCKVILSIASHPMSFISASGSSASLSGCLTPGSRAAKTMSSCRWWSVLPFPDGDSPFVEDMSSHLPTKYPQNIHKTSGSYTCLPTKYQISPKQTQSLTAVHGILNGHNCSHMGFLALRIPIILKIDFFRIVYSMFANNLFHPCAPCMVQLPRIWWF